MGDLGPGDEQAASTDDDYDDDAHLYGAEEGYYSCLCETASEQAEADDDHAKAAMRLADRRWGREAGWA